MESQRFYPSTDEHTFAMLLLALRQVGFGVKSQDGYSKSVSFSTPMSGFSWGANLSAHVRPVEGGALVSVSGGAKVKTNLTASGAEKKNIERLLDAVSAQLQGDRPADQPAPNWYPDPHDNALQRYWSGTAWTEHTAPR